MKKTIVLGEHVSFNPHTQTSAAGDLIVEISDIAVDDWKNQRTKLTDRPLGMPVTITQWFKRLGGTQGKYYNPINKQYFTLDLSPWTQIDGNRYLRIDIGWVRK